MKINEQQHQPDSYTRRIDEPWLYNFLYNKPTIDVVEYYENITSPPISAFFTQDDIEYLNYVIMSPKFANIEKKADALHSVLLPKGFKKIAGGTNRYAYENSAAPGIVFKGALDKSGAKDSPRELYNQNKLKPYCTKVFEVSPYGIIGTFERVDPIRNSVEYETMSAEILHISKIFTMNNLVLEDFGSKFFLNWGVRRGYCPVILDFPYVYTLDYKKLICNKEINGRECGGRIDYSSSLNFLYCTKCNKMYRARELMVESEDDIARQATVASPTRGRQKMKVSLMRGDEVIKSNYTPNETASLKKIEYGKKKNTSNDLVVAFMHGDKVISRSKNGVLIESGDNVTVSRNITTKKNHSMSKREVSGKIVQRVRKEEQPVHTVEEEKKDTVETVTPDAVISITKSDIMEMIHDVENEYKSFDTSDAVDGEFSDVDESNDSLGGDKLIKKKKDKKKL